MSFFDWLVDHFRITGDGSKAGGPGGQKPHDERGGETIDPSTGIGMVDGQELDNTSIDPDIQDREHGFPVSDPENPEKSK